MKTFKTFLFEEMTANNVSISDVAPQITDTPKDLNFISPTGPSTKPMNKRDDDEDYNNEPDFETWLANHPMPPLSADENDDGVVTAAEQAAWATYILWFVAVFCVVTPFVFMDKPVW